MLLCRHHRAKTTGIDNGLGAKRVKITRRLSHLRFAVVLSVLVAGSMMSLAPSVYAQTIKLAWDPSADSSVAGYNVYRSQQSGVYSTPVNGSNIITTTSFTDSGVHSGTTYYYVVTTVNTSGVQSSYSNEVLATVPVLTTNKAPVVNAGPDQAITLPAKATLAATATDDGLPSGVLTYSWTVVSGTGVTLSTPTASTTQASFSAAGTYTLRITVSDGQLSSSDDVIVIASAAQTLITNKAPVVNAGPDQTITFPAAATLAATATDDGLPNGVLTYLWTVVSGSGVSLSNPTESSTQATFSAAGTYTFRVTVNDGQLTATDDIIVTVQSASALTLLVSKSGEVLKGAITSIKEYSNDSKVKRLELYIDQNETATIDALSLTYKWDLRKVSGTHVVSGKAYDANNHVVATADVTVSVK
jgi:fibronectin type 3 domain-containing protein